MKTRIYDIPDEDVLAQFFSEDSPVRPYAGLGENHGKVIFNGTMSTSPQENDIIMVDEVEYFVLLRIVHAEADEVELLVHRRTFQEGVVS